MREAYILPVHGFHRRLIVPFFRILCALVAASAFLFGHGCLGQSLPTTPGETLSGKPMVLADAVRGHRAVLIAGFSREGGAHSGEWAKAIHADPAFADVALFQVAELEGAPGFVRGMIRNGMKKSVLPADQDRFVVLTTDTPLWQKYFGVASDKDAYIMLLGAQGTILWHGHGAVAQLEPLLRAALR